MFGQRKLSDLISIQTPQCSWEHVADSFKFMHFLFLWSNFYRAVHFQNVRVFPPIVYYKRVSHKTPPCTTTRPHTLASSLLTTLSDIYFARGYGWEPLTQAYIHMHSHECSQNRYRMHGLKL